MIPAGVLWLVGAVVHAFHYKSGTLESVPSVWLAMFYVGGPITVFSAAMLVAIRRRERCHLARK